jgi:tetratricopeptide (TPR) repeat protein
LARADRRRASRSRPPASIRASSGVAEQVLFFERLRRQAKWAFVFLALVFGVGFVVFGVGSDVPGGIADVLQGSSSTGQPSVDEAREKLEKNPRDAEALRELATGLQTQGRSDEAINPLERYVALRPKDEDAMRELASLYLTKASRLREDVSRVQAEAQVLVPGTDFLPPVTTPFGQALSNDPVSQAVQTKASERVNAVFTRMQRAYQQAQAAYARVAQLAPDDPNVQLELANAALNAGDTGSALAAYRRFLTLAPDDRNAPLVRAEIKRLERAAGGG